MSGAPGRGKQSAGWFIVAVVAGAAMVLALGAMAWSAGMKDSNHVGYDIRWVWGLCALAVAWAAWGARRRPRMTRAVVCLTLLALVLAGVVFVFDRYNVLVEYETWVARGMPEPWSLGTAPSP